MRIRASQWPRVLYRVVRDRAFEAAGHVPRSRRDPAAKVLSGIQLGLRLRCNGSDAYVLYHGNHFAPRAYANLGAERVAWLRIDEIGRFNSEVLPRVEGTIVVVTGESDLTVPSAFPRECAALVESGRVKRWFAVNYDGSAYGSLVTAVPLGMNFHAKHSLEYDGSRCIPFDAPDPQEQERAWLEGVSACPIASRLPLAFGDFWLNNSSRHGRYGETRADISSVLRRSGCVVFPERILATSELAEAYRRHAFVISPHGRALDCFRTWEALLSGCIAIVKRSPIDPLYDGLPVAIVEDWREVTQRSLEAWIERFGDTFDRTRLIERLSLDYWLRSIAAAR